MTSKIFAIDVDPSNADELQAWDGVDGEYWADHEAVFDDSVLGYRQAFMDSAAIRAHDRVLDIGCGNGQTTIDAARLASDASAFGVDLSARMTANARRRADEQKLSNVAFMQADAQVYPFTPASYHIAISRAGTMFFGDVVAAFTNIARALRPHGRLSMLVWQSLESNDWVGQLIDALGVPSRRPRSGVPGAFSLSDPAYVTKILDTAGFVDPQFTGVAKPMRLGRTAEQAFGFVRRLSFVEAGLSGLDADARETTLNALHTSIERHVTAELDPVPRTRTVW